ncbi:MAG TPA: PAS domain S-box protein [Thermoanaerobaculaceae bacterium]|nr:PAS domain S-box protein [Thermoanaerobaculaceae bacterium]HRS17364.1 PAS domain S-box protein [Thermoanaerobaculaceae bacterium]
MSVRTRAAVLLAAGVAGLLATAWVVFSVIVAQRIRWLEEEAVRRDVQRAVRAIDGEVGALAVIAGDWGKWDDAFVFMTEGNDSFVRANLVPDTLRELDLCAMVFLDTRGEVRFGLERPGPGAAPRPLSDSHLATIRALAAAAGRGASLRGLVVIDGQVHLAAVHPVTRTDGSGPSPGAVVMARGLAPGVMPRLAAALDLDVELAVGAPVAGGDKYRVEPLDSRHLLGTSRLQTLLDGPELALRVKAERTLSREGVSMARLLTLALAVIQLVFGLAGLWLLDRDVLARLGKVEATARLIAANADPRARVEARGRDEVGRLAASINTMLAALERSEAEARASEERYRAVVEDQAELVCRWRPDGEIVFANRAFCELFGEAGGVWVGSGFLDLVAGGDPAVRARIQARSIEHPLATFVTSHQAGDGSTRWVQWTDRTIFDGAGTVAVEHQAVGRDITAQRQSEEALRAAEKAVRAALDGAPETAMLTDLGGRILAFFDATPGRLDVTVSRLAGSQVADHLGSAATAWWSAARHAIAEGRLQLLEATRAGRTLQVAIQPVLDGAGAVRQLAVFTRDVTDRLRAEEAERKLAERAQIEMALQGTRDLLRQISRSIREILWTRDDVTGRFSYVSPGFEHIWQRSCEELYADPGVLLAGVHPDDRASVELGMKGATGGPRTIVDFRVVRPDGSIRWVAAREFPLEGGEAHRLLGLAEDVTERKDMEQQSRRLEAQLRLLARRIDEAREEERRKLAAWIHDDVGQLLTALRLDLAWLEHRMPKARAELRARLAEMQSLLEARITAVQQVAIELRPSILEDLGLRAALEWAAAGQGARSGLEVALDMELPGSEIPRSVALAILRITQEALTNIARHAGARQVRIGVRRDGPRVVLAIADDGRGIRAEEATGFRALGILGMRERTMAHGGTLEVRARPEGGTELVATMLLGQVGQE